MRDLDRVAAQHFVDWLTTRPGRAGRLCDRSIANALTPLLLALDAAVAEGRWMGHHSPAFTLETYGHLIDGELGPALDLRKELRGAQP